MLLICGRSRRKHSLLITGLDLQTRGRQAGRQFLSTDSQPRSLSEEKESHFVMSFLPQIGSGGRGRRGSSTGADTGPWWELEKPLYEKNITRMIMPLCFSVASPLSLSRSGLCSLCHVKVHFTLLTKLSENHTSNALNFMSLFLRGCSQTLHRPSTPFRHSVL